VAGKGKEGRGWRGKGIRKEEKGARTGEERRGSEGKMGKRGKEGECNVAQ